MTERQQKNSPQPPQNDGPRFLPLNLPGRDLKEAEAEMRDEYENGREMQGPWNMARLETPEERRARNGERNS